MLPELGLISSSSWSGGERGGLLADASHLWWDLRPHARFGTLELRVADAQTRVEDATAIAAVYHCLLALLAERHDESSGLAAHEATRIAENSWSAARYGTRGWMVDLETGERQETRARISELLDTLAPTADRLGATWALLTAQSTRRRQRSRPAALRGRAGRARGPGPLAERGRPSRRLVTTSSAGAER